MSAIDSTAPFIASAFFTYIFKATMDNYPGTCFLIQSTMLLVPITIVMWVDLYTVVPEEKRKKVIVKNDQESPVANSKL